MSAASQETAVGVLLRDWRLRRRRSQLDLSLDAGISARHLSFVETGRSRPSPDMVERLAEHLDVPLRDRNTLLLAAGFAPQHAERALDHASMGPVREALDMVLRSHEPYPAAVVDRHWNLVSANAALGVLIEGVDPTLLAPPINVLRASLHPLGMAPRILNFEQWRGHLLHRLARQVALTGDAHLTSLLDEGRGYPAPDKDRRAGRDDHGNGYDGADPVDSGIAVPLRLRAGKHQLCFLSTITTFGTAIEITASELSIESFFPGDKSTAEFLRALPLR
ncbi:MAG: helix-turn-helix transcriptional regulator [Actinomycetota bacterium]|nr:helix-turn-helix transcriptional regulator [Actinomycetota bacterium]